MKKGKFKSNFLFIVGISIIVIVLFSIGFATFYKDSSFVFSGDGYIINATENSSDSYSFASGTKYKANINKDIAFEDTSKKSVSVDSASFVHYNDGSVSFLQNGALMDLDKVNEDYVPYYNISNKFMINYENGKYNITNDTKSLEFTNWIGRISDDKYMVVGENLSLKIPGVNKTIEGDYFELLFMTDGVVKIDNQDVSYQVTAQGSTIYVGDNIKIDLGENQIYYDNNSKMYLSQITISGDENIDLDDGEGGSGGGGGGGTGNGSGVSSGTTSGATSGVLTSGTMTSGTNTSGTLTSGTGEGSGEGEGGSGEGAGGGAGEGAEGEGDGEGAEGDGTGEGSGEGSGGSGDGSGDGEKATSSATIELIKLDVTATSMYATLQMNRSSLIGGSLAAYLTNIGTGQRVEVNIKKEDGTLEVCSSGTACYSFNTSLMPDNQYLLSIIDVNNSRQYFQKLITTSELGVNLEKTYTTSSSLTYDVNYTTNTSVAQLDLYLYDSDGNEVFKQVGINETMSININNLKAYSAYNAVIKNVSVCDEDNNCSFDDKFEISRTDMTLKSTPVIQSIAVKKNVDSASFDLSAVVDDKHETVTKYVYTVCKQVSADDIEADPECFSREKTDGDALSVKVGTDIYSGIVYIYTFKVQYNDGQMEREVIYNGSSLFSMESLPYFQLTDKVATSNTITGKLSLVDPSCTVPFSGRVCTGKPEMNMSNKLTLKYFKLVDGEEKAIIDETTLDRANLKYDDESELYYYDINLTNLAAETKYVIKVYGDYVLNGESFTNVQIGDELYAETASTGNLKFVYTDNISNDSAVINFNAKLGGGNTDTSSDGTGDGTGGTTEEDNALSALNSIEKLTFDLYAGTYADDSEVNNRHIGEQKEFTGNSNIKKNFCNADTSSDVCNTSFNITNGVFGLNSLRDLVDATMDLKNFCSAQEKFCLSTAYTVVVKGYDKAGNAINIDNDTYTFNITPSYYVTTQLKNHGFDKAINITPIRKGEFKKTDEEGKVSYDFSAILDVVEDDLKDEATYKENLELIADDTLVGVQVHASVPQNYINSAYKYNKVVTNYYICEENAEVECNSENAVEKHTIESVNYTDSNHIFYLNDGDFTRGKTYTVMYELVFTLTNGDQSIYCNDYTITSVPITRQAPIYNFYIMNSTKNTITYGYNIKDVDGAINTNEYFFYYTIDGSKDIFTTDAYTLGADKQITFNICEESCNGTKYAIYIKQKLLGETGEYFNIEDTVFDGDYAASETDKFELYTFTSDNRLYIKLNDEELGNRTAIYRVKVANGDGTIYDRYYLASKLGSCSTDSEEVTSIMCQENPGDYKYITVDYAYESIAKNIGENLTVTVDSYYDSGLVGVRQTFENGLVLQNRVKNKYLNIYGISSGGNKTVIEAEDDATNGVYIVDNNEKKFGNDTVTLYHMLGISNINNYSNNIGASLYDETKSASINKEYKVSYLSTGIKLGNYSNYNPKVVRISSLSYDENNFKFDSIIPKVGVTESRGINSLGLKFAFDGVSDYILSSQFKSESGKYYLYVNLYDENDAVIKKDVKVSIDLENGTSTLFTDLGIKTKYKYDVWVYMKNGDTYNKVQVYDKNYNDSYVKTIYETSTLSEDELLSKVIFKANPVAYKNNGKSISDKTISYNIKVANGAYLKIRLGLYDKEGNQVNFDGNACDSATNCYVEISDASHSIVSMSNTLHEYNFNNNTYVFGDNYYTLKVYAIPYYSTKGYDTSKQLTLYDSVLSSKSKGKEDIDVSELVAADFVVDKFTSGYNTTDKYYISFDVASITDNDYVMKNGEYFITLYDNSGNEVAVVKNSGDKTIMTKDGVDTELYDQAVLYSSNKNVSIKFPNLNNNTQYSIELSYVTYRNNVSFGDDEAKKTAVSPYTNYIYTPINEGITLGNVLISKSSSTSFKLEYIGSNNINNIKRVDYKVNLLGSTYSTSGVVSGDSIFVKSGNNYSLSVDLTSSDNSSFKFESSGTYNVTITYYSDVAGTKKIYSSTFSILV